jgi:hypothetical protein
MNCCYWLIKIITGTETNHPSIIETQIIIIIIIKSITNIIIVRLLKDSIIITITVEMGLKMMIWMYSMTLKMI